MNTILAATAGLLLTMLVLRQLVTFKCPRCPTGRPRHLGLSPVTICPKCGLIIRLAPDVPRKESR